MASGSDDFNRADAANLGANWTTQSAGVPTIASNKAVSASGVFTYNSAYYNAATPGADHQSDITRGNVADYCAPGTRMSATGGSTNWYAHFNHGSVQKSVAGSTSVLGSTSAFGTTGGLKSIGTTHTPYSDGVAQTPITDASLATGTFGVVLYDAGGSSIDAWVGTDLTAGGGGGKPWVFYAQQRRRWRPESHSREPLRSRVSHDTLLKVA